jgi:prophage tail gpP-like protein
LSVKVRVNGETFTRFKQVDLSRSRDDFAGECRIIVSQQSDAQSFIKQGDLIELFFDGTQKLTGYVEKITDSESKDSHDISFRARDKVADLIDSSCPDNVKNIDNVSTYAALVQLCIDGLGLTDEISVTDTTNATFDDSTQLKAAEVGQTVGDFLNENARLVNVFLNTDGKGNVLISLPSDKLSTVLQNIPGSINNNVISSEFNYDISDRFYEYKIYSNSSLATDDADADNLDNSGTAYDTEIRSTRLYEAIADKPMTSAECKRAAKEEANIRRARSFEYNCKVAGFSANGELWLPGKKVKVNDELKGIVGTFQLNTCEWSYSRDDGEITSIKATLPDKGTDEANATTSTTYTTEAGSTYTVVDEDALWKIAEKHNTSTLSLIAANPQIEDPDLIYPGQKINMPIDGDED